MKQTLKSLLHHERQGFPFQHPHHKSQPMLLAMSLLPWIVYLKTFSSPEIDKEEEHLNHLATMCFTELDDQKRMNRGNLGEEETKWTTPESDWVPARSYLSNKCGLCWLQDLTLNWHFRSCTLLPMLNKQLRTSLCLKLLWSLTITWLAACATLEPWR